MNYVGKGIYSLPEVSRYTGMGVSKLRHWFRGRDDRLFHSDYSESSVPYAISFYDLIDARVVTSLREMGISMKDIRNVREVFSTRWGTPHPYCMRKFYVDVRERRVLEELRSASDDDGIALADALMGQGYMDEVIRPDLEEIDYSAMTEIAEKWHIAPGIVIDPLVMLGKPVLDGSRLTTQIVASQYYAYDGDAFEVADLYDIDEQQVRNAVEFEASRGTVKSAA